MTRIIELNKFVYWYYGTFITGADGFIGSHLTEKLVNKGTVKCLTLHNLLTLVMLYS